MSYSLRCPLCREKFPWDPKCGMPRFCACCGEEISEDRDDDDVVMPFVRSSAKTAAIDKVYRDMEKGAETRAKLAGEMLGEPASEFSSLKITNMRDNQRPGDIAAMPVNNEVSRLMEAHPNVTGFNPQAGLAYSGAVQQGPTARERNSGAKMRTALQDYHGQATHGFGVSERPALETIQPGYKRRG